MEAVITLGATIPVLGVCLGHQAICQAFGGRIIHADQRVHGKTSRIHHRQEGLFQHIPTPFTAARYHSLVADPEMLPEALMVTAQTEEGVIMAVQHRQWPVYGLQFHPESIASEHGKTLLRQFIHEGSEFHD